MRLGFPSTLMRGVFSSKRHRSENALESGSKRKRVHIVLVRTVKNGRKRIQTKTSQAHVFAARAYLEFNLRRNVQFFRFQTF